MANRNMLGPDFNMIVFPYQKFSGRISLPPSVRNAPQAPAPSARQSLVALGRRNKPREVVQAILFPASAEATYIHGSNLVIDGAYVIR